MTRNLWCAAIAGCIAINESHAVPDIQFETVDTQRLDAALAERHVVPDTGIAADGAPTCEPRDAAMRRSTSAWLNDGSHVARGSTLLLNVFVDHAGGTWQQSERWDAGVKAAAVEHFITSNAPDGANLSFPHSTLISFVVASVPYDINDYTTFHNWMIDDAAMGLGFTDLDGDGTRMDDMTEAYQDTEFGYDNVILVFQPADYHFNDAASSSVGTSWFKVGVEHPWAVWAHQAGRVFGACEEFAASGCIGCAEECGTYLATPVSNGNCENGACGGLDLCVMRNGFVGAAPCAYTQLQWGWGDAGGDGVLDPTRRWDPSSGAWETVFDLPEDGWFVSDDPTYNWAANQRRFYWSAVGVRSRGDSQHWLTLYKDPDHNHPIAADFGDVAFVVGDFNHARHGRDFVAVSNAGGPGDYVVNHASGQNIAFSDGAVRSRTWHENQVVHMWDVPLFGGETVTFELSSDSPMDFDMALFKSDGEVNYMSIGDALASATWNGWGDEVIEVVVPEDDVYGLAIFTKDDANGSYDLRIGPEMTTLPEEVTYYSTQPLRLYRRYPVDGFWSGVAVRTSPGTDAELSIADVSTFQYIKNTSSNHPTLEWIIDPDSQAVDYIRVSRMSGAGAVRTEWDLSQDFLVGYHQVDWYPWDIIQVRDVYMEEGQTYLFRQYDHVSAPEASIYVFEHSEHVTYTRLNAAAGSETGHYSGEWFEYTAPETGFYGFVTVVDSNTYEGNINLGFGPRISLDDGDTVKHPNELLYLDVNSEWGTWSAVGARPSAGDEMDFYVWDCDHYGASCSVGGDASGSNVRFMAFDGHHEPSSTWYPRARRTAGVGAQVVAYDVASFEEVVYDVTGPVEDTFGTDDVLHIRNLNVPVGSVDVEIEVTPLVPGLDIGVVVMTSEEASVRPRQWAAADANDGGPGVTETAVFSVNTADIFGLVVTNENGAAGSYRIEVREAGTVDAPIVDLPSDVEFTLRAGRASSGSTSFELSLPEAGAVALEVFDLQGRRVRTLVNEPLDAGVHDVAWDGRRDAGGAVASGIYFAKLRALGVERTEKLVRLD